MRVKVKYSRRREGFLLSGRTSWWANYLFLGDSYNIKINYNKVSYIDSIVLRSLNLRLVNHLGSNLINGNEDSFILGSRIFKPSGTLNNLRYLSLRRKGFLRTYRGLVIGNSGFNNHFYDFNLVGSYSKFYYHRYLLKRIVKRSCLKPRRRFKRRGKRKRRRPNFYKYYRRLRKKKRKSSRRRKKRKRKRRHKKFRFFFQKTNIPGYRRFRIRYRPRCYRFHHKYVHYRTNLLFRTINKVKYYIGLLYNSNFLFTPRCNYISKQFLGKSVLNYSDSNDSKFSNFFLKKKLIKNLVYSFGIRRSRRCRRRKGPLFRTWYRLYPKNVIKSFKPIGFMYSRWKRKYRVYGYSCEYQMQRYKFNRFLRKKFFFKRRNKFNFSEALPYIYKHRNIINLRKSIEIKRRFKRSHDIYKNIRYSLLDFCRDLMLTKLKCKNILSNFKILRINNFLFYKYRKLIRLNYKFYNSYNLSNSYKFWRCLLSQRYNLGFNFNSYRRLYFFSLKLGKLIRTPEFYHPYPSYISCAPRSKKVYYRRSSCNRKFRTIKEFRLKKHYNNFLNFYKDLNRMDGDLYSVHNFKSVLKSFKVYKKHLFRISWIYRFGYIRFYKRVKNKRFSSKSMFFIVFIYLRNKIVNSKELFLNLMYWAFNIRFFSYSLFKNRKITRDLFNKIDKRKFDSFVNNFFFKDLEGLGFIKSKFCRRRQHVNIAKLKNLFCSFFLYLKKRNLILKRRRVYRLRSKVKFKFYRRFWVYYKNADKETVNTKLTYNTNFSFFLHFNRNRSLTYSLS